MRVFLVGGSGFLGSRIAARLVERGDQVSGLARSPDARASLEDLGVLPVAGDLAVPEQVEVALRESDADTLVTSTSFVLGYGPHIVAAAEAAGYTRGAFVSTTSLFTTLDSPTKPIRVAAEEAVRASALEWTILRPTMIYGAPGDRNMERLVRLVARAPFVPLPGGGGGLQQPVHVDDVTDAVVRAVSLPCARGRAYQLAGPEALSLKQVVDEVIHASGRRVRTVPIPLWAAIRFARVAERFTGGRFIKAEQFERLAEDKVFDISRARDDLGFDPLTFAEGIRRELLVGAKG